MESPTLYLTVGISASGKSTFTKHILDSIQAVEVNADNIRAELGDISDQSNNKKVFEILDERVNQYLAGGYNVIISNTNLNFFTIEDYHRKYPFNKICVFILMDSKNPELCKERIHNDTSNGIKRSKVPDEIVDKQFEKFEKFLKDLSNAEKNDNITFLSVNEKFEIFEMMPFLNVKTLWRKFLFFYSI